MIPLNEPDPARYPSAANRSRTTLGNRSARGGARRSPGVKPMVPRLQASGESRRDSGQFRREIVCFARIALEVVELWLRLVDQLERARPDRAHFAPPESSPYIQVFSVDISCRLRTAGAENRHEASAVHIFDGVDSQHVEHGGHQIRAAHRRLHPPARRDSWCADDEGHTEHGLIDEQSVCQLTVIAHPFTVVSDDRDDRAFHETVLVQEGTPGGQPARRSTRPRPRKAGLDRRGRRGAWRRMARAHRKHGSR